MNKLIALAGMSALLISPILTAQDVMQYGVKHIKVLAEDDRVRVLRFAPKKGDKTPVHSHPYMVVYVVKGGRLKTTLPDGSVKVLDLKTGEVLLRQPVTHTDEALDDVDAILVESKQ
jgi:quercetin dioxygenase-like cupin family protein